MQRALSTHLLANQRLTTVWLDRIGDADIPLVEIFCARQHLDYTNRAQVSELSYWFRDSEIKVHSVHAPLYTDEVWGRSGPQSVLNITEPVKSKRILVIDELKRAIEIAETIPFRYLIQHMGVADQEFDERSVDAAFSALEELNIFARQRGVEVLLENIPNGLSSAERLLMFLGMTHLDLNICFDIGHAHMNEGVETAYRLLQSHIRSVHIHDNAGTEDSHLFPLNASLNGGGGTIDWKRAMRLLRPQMERFPLVLELREVEDMPNPLLEVRKTFDALETLLLAPESEEELEEAER
jgi:sugar phosphate isomerase/epimerase